MKHSVKLLSLLLSLALLLSCLPGAAAEPDAQTRGGVAEPDFSALVETGGAESVPGVILLSEPIYYAGYISGFFGKYAAFRDKATGCYGVTDYEGHVLWCSSDPEITDLWAFSSGLCAVFVENKGWQPYTVSGKRLCPENYYGGGVLDGRNCDWATGQELFLVCSLREYGSTVPFQCLLVDAAGHSILAEELGLVYRGTLPVKRGGKWGLCDLNGTELLPYQYDELSFVDADTLVAKQNGVYCLIDRNGNTVASLPACAEFFSVAPYAALVMVRENGLWGVRDADGALLVEPCWDMLQPQYYGQDTDCWFRGTKDGVEHFLSADGVDLALPVSAGNNIVAMLSKDRFVIGHAGDGYQAVDGKGTPLLEETFDLFSYYSGDPVVFLEYRHGSGNSLTYSGTVCDTDLQPLFRFENVRFIDTTDDSVVYEKDGSVYFVSLSNGTELARIENAAFVCTSGRFALVMRNGMFAMADTSGQLLTDFNYKKVSRVLDGLAIVGSNDKYYLLDSHGQELTPPLYSGIMFNETESPYAAYQAADGKYGFLKYRGADDPLFADVAAGSWYAEGADFCAKTGLMNGVGGGKFAPQKVMTRAMLVRVLYNLSGSPCASYGFEDVPAGTWYTDAVNWAAANGIVNGKSATRFAPNDPVTREQIATILLRYAAKFAEFEVSDDALAAFADEGQVSAFAREAMQWAVTQGLIQGVTATELRPNGQATRAQVATILTRLVKLMAAAPTP